MSRRAGRSRSHFSFFVKATAKRNIQINRHDVVSSHSSQSFSRAKRRRKMLKIWASQKVCNSQAFSLCSENQTHKRILKKKICAASVRWLVVCVQAFRMCVNVFSTKKKNEVEFYLTWLFTLTAADPFVSLLGIFGSKTPYYFFFFFIRTNFSYCSRFLANRVWIVCKAKGDMSVLNLIAFICFKRR